MRRTVDETAKVQLRGSRLTYCRRVSPWHQSTRRSIGHERNTSRMPRLRPFWSVTADVLLRQRPGEEDEEDDEGDGKEDDDKDDGYSE